MVSSKKETGAKSKNTILDIIESVYQSYLYVNATNKVFYEYKLGQWKFNECKILCNIPEPADVQGGGGGEIFVVTTPPLGFFKNFKKTFNTMCRKFP